MRAAPTGGRRLGSALSGALLASLALGAAVAAQAPPAQPQEQPVFRSGVDLIEVDARVVDDDGRPVVDLGPADFAVTVDGEPRPVVEAQFIRLAPTPGDTATPDGGASPDGAASAAPTATAAEDAAVPTPPGGAGAFHSSNADQAPGRLIVVVVEEESLLFGEGRHVMRAAADFVGGLGPADRVALLAAPQPGVYIDFTADHERVRRTLASMAGLGRPLQTNFNIGLFEAYQITVYGNAGMENTVVARVCAAGFDDVACRQMVRAESRQIVEETRRRTDDTRRELESILGALDGVEGPKALVWISGGLVIDGAGLLLREVERRAAAARTTLYVVMLDELLIDSAQRELAPTPRQDRRMQEEGLLAAASLTGGRLLRAGLYPAPLFARIGAELSGYYLLGVESRPADRERETHDIGVAVLRDGARVRAPRTARRTVEAPPASDPERLLQMLLSPVAVQELPLRVATYGFRSAAGGGMQVLTAVEVAEAGGADGAAAAGFTLAYLLRDPEGGAAWTETLPVRARRGVGPAGPVLLASLPIPVETPGRYDLRIAVIDPRGRRGSVDHPLRLDRPAPAPVAAGALLLADQASSPAGGIRPPVEARVASGRLLAYTELYAASSQVWEGATVHLEVTGAGAGGAGDAGAGDREDGDAGDAGAGDEAAAPVRARGAVTLDGPDDAARRAVTGVVGVAHLPPGRYVARVRVVHEAAEVARAERPFRVAAPLPSGAPPAAAPP